MIWNTSRNVVCRCSFVKINVKISEIACQNKCKLLGEKENEDGFSINIFVKKLHFSLLKYLKFHPILLIVIEQNMIYQKYTCANEKYLQLNFFVFSKYQPSHKYHDAIVNIAYKSTYEWKRFRIVMSPCIKFQTSG